MCKITNVLENMLNNSLTYLAARCEGGWNCQTQLLKSTNKGPSSQAWLKLASGFRGDVESMKVY